jgi:uncharacterized membrane protein
LKLKIAAEGVETEDQARALRVHPPARRTPLPRWGFSLSRPHRRRCVLLSSILIGAIAGARSMTPLAAVSLAAQGNRLPAGGKLAELLARPVVVGGSLAMAAGELAGDKLPSAPDRIVVAGLAARLTTGAIAAAALAPIDRRKAGALLGALAAVAASYPTFYARMRAMRRFGQTSTGLVEDAAVIGLTHWVVDAAHRDAQRHQLRAA